MADDLVGHSQEPEGNQELLIEYLLSCHTFNNVVSVHSTNKEQLVETLALLIQPMTINIILGVVVCTINKIW